jgi:hypothetical protein
MYFIEINILQNLEYILQVGHSNLELNVLQLQEVGDYEALNYLPPLNLIRSTKLNLNTDANFL